MPKKLKHLELIQNVINRLANSSFFLKGWTVIFVAAVLGFATKDSKPMYVWLAAIPTLSFWGWMVSISIKNCFSGGYTIPLEKPMKKK